MSEVVQKYYDCGCALLVTGERVWCPTCTANLSIGSCGHFCEACARRDDRIKVLEKQLAERDAALARCVEALNYLMDRFDNEMWNCPACGHAEETSTMDSAFYLRDWLKTNSLPTSAQATAKVLAAARNLEMTWNGFTISDLEAAETALIEAIREEQEGK